MDVLGWVFLALLAVVVLMFLVIMLLSVPDIARYLRIKKL
ncbi:MAG: DUF6893 family small protein [Pseudonocardiaceae bacterium]